MEFAKLNPYVRYARAHQNIVRPLEPAVCYDCRLFYFHKASGTFQWDQQVQKLWTERLSICLPVALIP